MMKTVAMLPVFQRDRALADSDASRQRAGGCRVAHVGAIRIDIDIDDLGSGHASLLGLLELRPDRVKIDRHLVGPVLGNETQRRLISSLIDIARALNITIVAEGVETMDHAEVLTMLGADILQGFASGRPEAGTQIFTRLARQQRAGIMPATGFE